MLKESNLDELPLNIFITKLTKNELSQGLLSIAYLRDS